MVIIVKDETLKKIIYVGIAVIIIFFFTKDIPLLKKEEIIVIDQPEDLLVLVNKTRMLPSDYIPNDLEEIDINYSNHNKYLRKDAKEAFEALAKDAKDLGYFIIAVSAYRDYAYQEDLYQGYVESKGQDYADKCCAKPGHSEHQTGLSVDVMGSNLDYDEFESSPEFEWMSEHAHLYGFIMRYPKGKEDITGFKYEPWHYRYVGISEATNIYEQQLSLEEYIESIDQKK